MRPEEKLDFTQANPSEQKIACSQCGAPMPFGMRFCRSCGNRLGEGSAEYTETVRFPNAKGAGGSRFTTPFVPGVSAPVMQQTTGDFAYRPKRRMRGMTWIWIAMAIFFAGGGGLSMLKRGSNIPRAIHVAVNRSYVGVDGFKSADGGVTFNVVEPPGSPADKAGLVGGDIVTSFDGKPVKDNDAIMTLLGETPPGKTVEVIYVRDGQTNKTLLTTISNAEFNQLQRAYSARPEGKGHLGFDDDDAKRVPVPGMNIYGVQMNDISRNGPADIAGLKEGDIVIEYDGVPIRTVAELVSRDHRTTPYSTVKMVVMRGGERLEIPVKLGKD
jgi:predicted metalloprotease with PDZ domain